MVDIRVLSCKRVKNNHSRHQRSNFFSEDCLWVYIVKRYVFATHFSSDSKSRYQISY
jgi:hypothetical protein